MRVALLVTSGMLLFASSAYASPTFILGDLGGVGLGTQARAGFEAAAAMWSSEFTNNVTIRLNVGFEKLGSGILGVTGSASSKVSYDAVRNAMGQGATSADDQSAYASLAPTLSFQSNSVPGQTASTAMHVLENNQANGDTQALWVTNANQKALGLRADTATSVDASIIFNSAYHYTFDASNGFVRGSFDFVGLAEHEIAHALGFVSGVDTADVYMEIGLAGLQTHAWGSPLDLFRYQNGVRDWTVGGDPCLSVDSGQTCGGRFSTGEYNGDHRQASHWRSGLHLGILNPSLSTGPSPKISANDLQALDVIGWNLSGQASAANGKVSWASRPNGPPAGTWSKENETVNVAEPGVAGLFALAATAALRRRRSPARG